jgi:ABC-2 type transport system permease protein
VPGSIWLPVATMVLTVAVSVAATSATRCPSGVACPVDPARLSLTGVDLGQAVVAILAVLAVSGAYSTGVIRATLAAMPRRATVLAAWAAAALLAGGLPLGIRDA